MSKLSDDSEKMRRELSQLRDNILPQYLENKLIQNTDKAFDNEQYPSEQKWKERSDKWLSQKSDKRDNKFTRSDRRGLLVGTGDLRRSIETDTAKGEVSIGSDKVYAQIHNEGLQGNAFGKHAFTMPERKFMPLKGDDLPFQNEVDQFIDNKIKDILG